MSPPRRAAFAARAAGGAVAALLLLLSAWWLDGGGDATSGLAAREASGDERVLPTAEPHREPVTVWNVHEATDAAAPSRTDALAPGPPDAHPESHAEPSLRVRVVHAEGGGAVRGADVWVEPSNGAEPHRRFVLGSARAAVATRPPDARTGDDGIAIVPKRADPVFLAAATREAFGLLPIGPLERDPVDVRIHRDAVVRAVAVDDRDVPRPEVPLALVAANGRILYEAALPPHATHLEIPEVEWRASGDLHRSEPFELALEAHVLGAEPMRLALARPDCYGQLQRVPTTPAAPVRVRVVAPGGASWAGRGGVRVLAGANGRPFPVEAGSCLLPPVTTKRDVNLLVNVRDPRHAPVIATVAAGRTPWIESALVVELGAPKRVTVAAGRILDASGRPASHQTFLVVPAGRIGGAMAAPEETRLARSVVGSIGVFADRLAGDGVAITTGADGRFELFVEDPAALRGAALHPQVTADDFQRFEPHRRARLHLPPADEQGRHELGDLVLEDTPLLVAGRVIDERGLPARRKLVRVSAVAPGAGTAQSGGHSGRVTFACESDAGGRFAVHAESGAGVAVIEPLDDWTRGGDVSQGMEVPVGATDVLLHCISTGALEVSVLLPPGVTADELQVAVAIGGGATCMMESFRGRECRIERVDSGRHTVSIVFGEDEEPLLRVADVEVAGDRLTLDPRLMDVDLRDRIFLTTVRVEGQGGEPLPGAILICEELEIAAATDASGRAEFVSTRNAFPVVVGAAGHRDREAIVGGASIVRLEPGLRLSATLAFDAPLGLHLLIHPAGAESDAEALRGFDAADQDLAFSALHGTILPGHARPLLAAFDAKEASVVLRRTGRVRVVPCWRGKGADSRAWSERALEVEVGAAGASVAFGFDAADWAAFVAAGATR